MNVLLTSLFKLDANRGKKEETLHNRFSDFYLFIIQNGYRNIEQPGCLSKPLALTSLTHAKSQLTCLNLFLAHLTDVRRLSGKTKLYVQNVSNSENVYRAVGESRSAEVIAVNFSRNILLTPFQHLFFTTLQ